MKNTMKLLCLVTQTLLLNKFMPSTTIGLIFLRESNLLMLISITPIKLLIEELKESLKMKIRKRD